MTARILEVVEERDGRPVEVILAAPLRRCAVCATQWWPPHVQGVVSPAGLEHLEDEGDTLCGHDATRDGWWWPL